MKNNSEVQKKISRSIRFIQIKEEQSQRLRQELNSQIAFNLKDTYKTIAKNQNSISVKTLRKFLDLKEEQWPMLQRVIRWNNNNSSLNLSFTQFSALLISKQDHLLAKMVLQRQQMGAIPNYILNMVKQIIKIQINVHQFCFHSQITNIEEIMQVLQKITNDNGQVNSHRVNTFMNKFQDSDTSFPDQDEQNIFMRYLSTAGHLSLQKVKYLWTPFQYNDTYCQIYSKGNFNTSETNVSNHKQIMLSPSSIKSNVKSPIRSQYFDCVKRPIFTIDQELRQKKSLQKHLKRIDSSHNIKQLQKRSESIKKCHAQIKTLLEKIKEILVIERQTQFIRVELCLCPDFYPVLFYDSIPKDRNGKITASNFKDYLQIFGIELSLKHCNDSYGMDFNNFCSMFDIIDNNYNLLEKNRLVQQLNDINSATKRQFFNLLKTLAKNQQSIDKIKFSLFKNCTDIPGALDFIFQSKGNKLTMEDIKELYNQYMLLNVNLNDVKLLWNRAKLNLSKDEIMTKMLFTKQIIPLQYSNIK